MKLLFVHDHPFYEEGNTIYGNGYFPASTWKNYLINFSELNVYSRRKFYSDCKKTVSSADNVSFFLTEKYTSVLNLIKNKKKIEKELEILLKDVDVVLVRLPSILGFIAGNIAVNNNKPLWIEQVGNAKEALQSEGSLLGKVAAPFFDFENKRLVKKADFISYVTENKLQKDYLVSSKAVAVSISNVIITSVLEEKKIDKERFFEDTFHIGLIGGFDAKYKGQDILLKAISLLKVDIRNKIHISLIGTGDYTWILNLAKKINMSNNLKYIGPLEPGEQINGFLKTLSLYVQPSLTEGMPRATIEAMAMGCPVIGSNVGGIPDIVSERFVHKKGNALELSKHIEFLYNNREILNEEAILSLNKAIPYLKKNLDQKRLAFYAKINRSLIK